MYTHNCNDLFTKLSHNSIEIDQLTHMRSWIVFDFSKKNFYSKNTQQLVHSVGIVISHIFLFDLESMQNDKECRKLRKILLVLVDSCICHRTIKNSTFREYEPYARAVNKYFGSHLNSIDRNKIQWDAVAEIPAVWCGLMLYLS